MTFKGKDFYSLDYFRNNHARDFIRFSRFYGSEVFALSVHRTRSYSLEKIGESKECSGMDESVHAVKNIFKREISHMIVEKNGDDEVYEF